MWTWLYEYPTPLQLSRLVTALLLGNALFEFSMKRREILKPEVAGRYKSLCRDSQPITTWLFGDELPKSIWDIAQAKRMSVKQFCDKRKFDGPSASTGRGLKRFWFFKLQAPVGPVSTLARPWLELPCKVGRKTIQSTTSSPANVNSTALVTPLVSYPPQGSGRLRLFVKNWAKITPDPCVLSLVPIKSLSSCRHVPNFYVNDRGQIGKTWFT
jgi:hypothetical protein